MQLIDWSATAAWIALAISITGTIVGPIVTTILTNRHQLKLRKLDIYENQYKDFTNRRKQIIENFISYTGQYIANPHTEDLRKCTCHFFPVYAYAPHSMWDKLDMIFSQSVGDILTPPPSLSCCHSLPFHFPLAHQKSIRVPFFCKFRKSIYFY